jgi:hypothetical protein
VVVEGPEDLFRPTATITADGTLWLRFDAAGGVHRPVLVGDHTNSGADLVQEIHDAHAEGGAVRSE